MGDVFDFRLVRAPQRLFLALGTELYPTLPRPATPASGHPAVPTPPGHGPLIGASPPPTFLDQLKSGAMSSRGAQSFIKSSAFVGDGASLPVPLRELDAWLMGKQNRATPTEIDTFLDHHMTAMVGASSWALVRRSLGDSLAASIVASVTPLIRAELTRLILVAALVEDLAQQPWPFTSADETYARLRWRTVIVPKELLSFTASNARLARRYGFSDYVVVREEWKEYRLGEIAHIENALAGERRQRVHKRVTESETQSVTETNTVKSEEHDTQTTDRMELNDHSQQDVSLAAHVDGKVETSGQFGPMKVDAQIGGSFDYSQHQAHEQAMAQAHETVARAVKKVEQEVRTARSSRQLERIEEINTHLIDNTRVDAQNVTAIYRWVDKIQRLQAFRYPHRFLLEFQIPEPAAFLSWRRALPKDDFLNPDPPPLLEAGIDGKPRPLTPSDITPENYDVYVARYRVPEFEVPPPSQIVKSFAFEMKQTGGTTTATAYNKSYEDATFIDLVAGTDGQGTTDAAIPPGYKLISWMAELQTYSSNPTQSDNGGNSTITVSDGSPTDDAPIFRIAVGQDVMPTIKNSAQDSALQRATFAIPTGVNRVAVTDGVPITVWALRTREFRAHMQFLCERLPVHLQEWQLRAYDKVVAAHRNLQLLHNEEKAARAVGSGVLIEGSSPERNAEVVREELKRSVIRLLSNGLYPPVDASAGTVDDDTGPNLDLDFAARSAPEVQFLEQAFEWENLSFVLYPYYWANKKSWKDRADIESTDPEFARFLRCGSARVIVPARPGFEDQVRMYVDLGVLWGAGPVPAVGDPAYLSIAEELKAQNKAPEDGVPGEWWDLKLPTTLVAIDGKATLPIGNPNLSLGGAPAP